MKVDWLDSPAIVGLLREIPQTQRAGFKAWPREQREKWLTAFSAVLDLEYPEPSTSGKEESSHA